MLEKAACPEAFGEHAVPFMLIGRFHIFPGAAISEKLFEAGRGNFGSVQRHAHAIATERSNHAGGVADQ